MIKSKIPGVPCLLICVDPNHHNFSTLFHFRCQLSNWISTVNLPLSSLAAENPNPSAACLGITWSHGPDLTNGHFRGNSARSDLGSAKKSEFLQPGTITSCTRITQASLRLNSSSENSLLQRHDAIATDKCFTSFPFRAKRPI